MRRHGEPLTLVTLRLADSPDRAPDPLSSGTALRTLAGAIRTVTRPTDVVSRRACCMLLLLPRTDEGHASQVAARVHRACAAAAAKGLAGLALRTDIIPVLPQEEPASVLARLEGDHRHGTTADPGPRVAASLSPIPGHSGGR
jgi:hypothetical protein